MGAWASLAFALGGAPCAVWVYLMRDGEGTGRWVPDPVTGGAAEFAESCIAGAGWDRDERKEHRGEML